MLESLSLQYNEEVLYLSFIKYVDYSYQFMGNINYFFMVMLEEFISCMLEKGIYFMLDMDLQKAVHNNIKGYMLKNVIDI